MPERSALPLSIKAGWLDGVRQVPVSRYGSRPSPLDISLVVLHGISLPPGHFGGPFVDEIFTGNLNPDAHPYFARVASLEVSTHVFIDRHGRITQYVSFLDRAWHAGRSVYQGRPECNDYGIGIELEGTDTMPYTTEQYMSLDRVLEAIYAEYPATRGHIAGHSEVAPGRKTDPGPYFDWSQVR